MTGGLALLGSSVVLDPATGGASSLDLHATAAVAAMGDAGVEVRDVDGLVTFGSFTLPHSTHVLTVADRLGMTGLRYAESVMLGGSSAVAALNRVRGLVASGVCRTVLLVSGDNQHSGFATAGALTAMYANRHPVFEQPYGPTTAALYALRATRYLHDHGVAPEMLAHATVNGRRHAMRSGYRSAETLCTVDEVNGSREICRPLRLLHCSKVTDGAAAVVAAADREDAVVRVLGCGERHRSGYYVHGAGNGPVGAGDAAEQALRQAGCSADDLSVAYIYDAFASALAPPIEEIGFCAPGTTFDAMSSGELSWDGRVTINPHGGLLSLGNPGYPSGLIHVAAAVAALKGGALPRDPERLLVHGSGGVMSTQAVAILGKD
jgi:acetyl-CoA acetyltransferase